MSVLKIGADDISEETQRFKDRLFSKDGEIANQQTNLMKQAVELKELRESLTEALQKLAVEDERTLRLQNDLTQCKNDLRNEKNICHNLQVSLQTANSKLKAQGKETSDLEATLERLSSISNDHYIRGRKLEEEKTALEGRVRELESNVRELHSVNMATSRRRSSRSSSASHNDLIIRAMDKDIRELHDMLSGKESEIQKSREKLTQAQDELLRADNERLVQEASHRSQVDNLQSLLKEKQEELDYHKEQDGGVKREMELLQRIEEDDAKIAALEASLQQSNCDKHKLQNMEQRLKAETEKVVDLRARSIDLEREREDTMNEFQRYRIQIQEMERVLQEKQDQLDRLVKEPTGSNPGDSQGYSLENTTTASTGEIDVLHVAKLLNAIERLREERDGLSRDLQFLETEHKFTVEALEKRSISNALPLDHNQTEPNGARGLVCIVPALAALVSRLQTRVDQSQSQLSESIEREEDHGRRTQADLDKYWALQEEHNHTIYQLKKSEERNETLEVKLASIAGEHDDLVSQLEEKKKEMKFSQKISQDHLDQVRENLEEVSRILEVVKSERDSLALQVTNLTVDLKAAQNVLANAEERYNALQANQPSPMSSSEATHALRNQIVELEDRVLRRTEQIGIHQHDIRRLETNLKLQEEIIGEMTLEFETLTTQNEAMLEDCADAREIRNEALSRVDLLEEEVELLESKLASSDQALKTLICLLVEIRKKSPPRYRITALENQVKNSQEKCAALEVNLDEICLSTTQEMRQAMTVLAISQLELKKVNSLAQRLLAERARFIHDLASANEQINEEHATNRQLEDECAPLHHGSSSSVVELADKSSEYQAEIDTLKRRISEVAEENSRIQKQLIDSSARVEGMQQEKEVRSVEYERARSQLALVHEAEVENLREVLLTATTTLEAERLDWAVSRQEHQEVLSRALSRINELEIQMGDLNDEVSRLSVICQDLEMKKNSAARGSDSLRTELNALIQESENIKKAQANVEDTNRHLSEEILRLREEREDLVKNLVAHTDKHQKLESLNLRLESQITELTDSGEDKAQEVRHLTRDLDMVTQCLREKERSHAAEMQAASVQSENAHARLYALEQQVGGLGRVIEGNQATLTKSKKEKEHLQEYNTDLEAQVQKSLSYTNALERQICEGESALEALNMKLINTQTELSRVETISRTSEINLSLQSAQFKRELTQLQDKLAEVESRHLEDALVDLEEKNNEMDKLLRAKCTEIEENDDRALEMLKENRKLLSKVELLTRKVQNLQAKLAAAKNTTVSTNVVTETPGMQELQTQNSRRRSLRLSTGTIVSALTDKPSSATVSESSTYNTTRPSTTILRPKTPERPTLVSKIHTPRQPRAQERITEPPSSVIGVKRRVPDDFENFGTIPPQGFTVESLPSRENESTTPRVRRMMGNLQSGFTPIRNKVPQFSKNSITIISAPLIQDVTNSPRSSAPLNSAAKEKRSWLGKIRGTSTQAAVRPASRQISAYVGDIRRL